MVDKGECDEQRLTVDGLARVQLVELQAILFSPWMPTLVRPNW